MMQIAICDDVKRDRNRLKRIINEIMNNYSISYQLIEYDSGDKLLSDPIVYQLIFMAIIMIDNNGIDIGRQIYRNNSDVRIIYYIF